jgi:arylformamidase
MAAEATTGPKGPSVFLDYDQAELDRCYDQANFAPNMAVVHERGDANSAAASARLGGPRRLAYGPTDIEKLDLFKARRPGGPIFIYVHGGSWRSGSSSRCHAPAEMFVDAGVNYIALDFINVGEAGGSLFPMIDQVRHAVAWVYRNAASFGGDPERIYVFGHSSGAHLTGNILTTDWPKQFDLPFSIIKGGMVACGMYDLAPVRLSARSKFVKFTDEMVEELSSIRHLDRLHCPIVIGYGDRESPEFQRQSRDFAAAVEKAGKPFRLLVGKGYNHFEMPETLANPYGLLGRAALELIGASRN